MGSSGKWNDEETLKYVIFVDFHRSKLQSKIQRRYLFVNLEWEKCLS